MAPTINGYVYWADIYCPACTIKEVRENRPESTSPSFGDLGTEQALDQLAEYLLLDREDERTFDSDDFPKVIFSTSIEAGDKCGRCGEEL